MKHSYTTEKKQQMLKRMETKISFDHSTDALKRFESTSEPPRDLDETLEESEEDEGIKICLDNIKLRLELI